MTPCGQCEHFSVYHGGEWGYCAMHRSSMGATETCKHFQVRTVRPWWDRMIRNSRVRTK